MTSLIALCSPAMRSGKSTVAEHLVDSFGFQKVSFATPIKAMTVALLEAAGANPEEIERRVYGDLKEAPIAMLGGKTCRYLQQTIGTEWGRELIDPQIWVNVTMAKVAALRAAGTPVVIDDMRFPNELDAVRVAGGTPIRIVRPSARVLHAHASEGQLDEAPMSVIMNDHTLGALRVAVERLLATR